MRDGDFFCTHVINGGCYKTGKKDTAISVFFSLPVLSMIVLGCVKSLSFCQILWF